MVSLNISYRSDLGALVYSLVLQQYRTTRGQSAALQLCCLLDAQMLSCGRLEVGGWYQLDFLAN